MPWYLDYSGPVPQALRHVTGVEDGQNDNGTTCNYCYPANPYGQPGQVGLGVRVRVRVGVRGRYTVRLKVQVRVAV